MGRKHKNNSVKFIKQSNERLKQENECLKQMANYATVRNIETQKKVTTLENYNNGLNEILKIQKEANDFQRQRIEIMESQLSLLNEQVTDGLTRKSEFSRTLALACSVKVKSEIKSEVKDDEKFCELK